MPGARPKRGWGVLARALGTHVGFAVIWFVLVIILALLLGSYENAFDVTEASTRRSSDALELMIYVGGASWLVAAVLTVSWWAAKRSRVLVIPSAWLVMAGLGAIIGTVFILMGEESPT